MNSILILFWCLLVVSQGRVYRPFSSRIINGNKVKPGEIPYQVSLQRKDHICGGSIINEHYVVTAAHCVRSLYSMDVYNDIKVAAGSVFYKKPLQKLPAERIIIHENYDPHDSERNDIALIKVKGSFVINGFVKPVPLPEQNQFIKTNSVATVSGWGVTRFTSQSMPEHLLKANVYISDQNYCARVLKEYVVFNDVYETNICANDPRERRGECSADSGGPLTVDGQLVGIVSWSIKDPYCASTKYPGVFTRVTKYIDWIKKHTSS